MTVGPNVGHAEVDVDLDADHLVAQGREAGEDAGEAYGDSFFRSADGRLRDARGKFVSDSKASGGRAGTAFGRSFGSRLQTALRGSNPFSGLEAQAEIQSNRILATFIRLGPLIAAAVGAAVLIGPALAAALPAAAALTGLIGVMVLGWDEMQKVIVPFDKMFDKIGASVGRILTEGLQPLAKELSGNLLPVLTTGLGEIAAATNNVITGFFNWLNMTETLQTLQDILTGVAPILNTLGQAAIVFSDALLTVTEAAIPAFGMLGDFLLEGAVAFKDWIDGLAQTGELTEAISGSMTILLGLIREFAGLFGQVLQLGQALGPAGLAFFQGLIDVLSVVIELLVPVAEALSANADSVRIFAQALGTLILISAGLQTLALILSGAVGALAALAAAFTIAFQNSAQFREVVGQIGVFLQSQVLPALGQFAAFVTGTIVPALQQFGAFIVANILPPLQQFANFITTQVVPAIVSLAQFFGEIGTKLGQFITFLQPVIEFLAGQFIPALVRLGEAFGELFGAVVQLAQALGPVLKPALIALGAIIIGGLLVAFAQIIIVITAVTVAVRIFAAGIRIVAAAVGFVVGIIGQLIGLLGRLAGFIAGVAVGAFASAAGSLRALGGAVSTVIGFVSSLIGFVSNLIGRLAAIPGNIPMPFGAWDFITTVIGWVQDLIGFLGDLPSSLPNPIDWALDGVVGLVSDLVGLLGSIPSSLPNPFSGWSVPDIPSFDLSLPGPLAFGGIFDRPFNAIVGEAGREVVVPLTKPQRALNLLEASGAADLLRNAGHMGSGERKVYGAENVYVQMPSDDPERAAERIANRISSRVVV